jgi:DNA-binding GntR family transcriptional regulator
LGKVDEYLQAIEGPLARMDHATEDDDYADYQTFIDADRDLHMILVEFSGNQRLIEIYRELNVHVHITRAHYMQSIENAREARQEHDSVIDALSHAGPAEAESRLLTHIDNVCRRILDLVEELGGEL